MNTSRLLSFSSLLFATIFTLSLPVLKNFKLQVAAANLTSISDTMTRIQASQTSSHDILFTLGTTTTWDAGETIAIDFNEDSGAFMVDGETSTITDFDINDGTERGVYNTGTSTDCTGSTGVNDISIGINDTTGVVTLLACPTFTSSNTNVTVNVEYGTAASGGTNRVTNPSANTYLINITAAADTGTFAIDILTSDQITITASVDPTLDVTISSTTCTLGTLSLSTIETCQYNISVSTNAANGYVSTILDDGNLRNGTIDIDDVELDNDIDQGSEEYGVATSKATQTIVQYTACTDPASNPHPASAITNSAQQFANANTPVNGDSTTLCHAASITGTTTAGSYNHTATIIVTASF